MRGRLIRFSLNSSIITLLVLAFAIACITPADSFGYDRKVLFEDFTSTTCPPCASAAPAVEAGLEEVGDEGVASIAYHMNWPGNGDDPWYHDNRYDNGGHPNGASPQVGGRREYYNVSGVPTYLIDGTRYEGQRTGGAFAEAIRERQEVNSPLMMELEGIIEEGTLIVDVSVTAEQDLNNVVLYVSLNENYYFFRAPTGQVDHYDSMLKMLPDYRGTNFSIEAEATEEFQFELDMEGVGWHELEEDNLILIAWVQRSDHTVYQAQNFFFFSEVSIVDWEITDAEEGDNDGRIEAGETADFVISLTNAPVRKTAENITVTLTTDDEDLTLEANEFVIESIASGEVVDNSANPVRIHAAENMEPHPVVFNLDINSEDGGVSIQEEITMMAGWPPFLIVDVAENLGATEAMMQYFGTGDLPLADHFSRAEDGLIPVGLLEHYPVVLWHSFNVRQEVINAFEEELVQSYLDEGGTFILSSLGYIRENGDGSFMQRYLGASIDEMDIGQNEIHGVAGDPHFSGLRLYAGGREGAGYPDFSPSILPLENSRAVLDWQPRGGESVGVSGVVHETDVYRTLLLAFPIESVAGFLGSAMRDEFLDRLWYWHQNPGSAPFEDDPSPVGFALDAAFPNPFNSSTVIPFTIGRHGQVRISLFNLAGQEVSRLFEGDKPQGSHLFNLNAGDAGLSSGLYYLQLEADGSSARQKVLYIR